MNSTEEFKTEVDKEGSETIPVQDFKAPTFKEDALVVYFHPYNFYSQKVLFILYEKDVDFIPYAIDLSNGEQYSNWFLNLNPKGEVPVLQDGDFILPDSTQIINYLEQKYSGEKHPSLCTNFIANTENERVQFYDRILGHLPIGALTLGSFIHEDLKLSVKPPFTGPLRQTCLKNNDKIYQLLKQSLADSNNAHNKLALIRKLDLQERRKRLVYSRFEFQKLLDAVQQVLLQVEHDLERQQSLAHEWLLSSEFTLADVNLGLLLNRLYQLGYENYFWSYGKMPYVESYFLRFKKRLAYQKLQPSHFDMLKDIWQKTPANLKIGAGFIGMAMFAALAHK